MSKFSPPKLFTRLFEWFCNPRLQETILGDMEEQFEEDAEQYGVRKARRRYAWNVIRFFRKDIIKPASGGKLNYYGMLRHNLLISLRSFKRHKTTFLINLIGLSTGIASAFLIYLWIDSERSVDKFPEKEAQLYRVMTHFDLIDKQITWEYTSGRIASSFLESYPEVEESARVNNKYFVPKGVLSSGSSFQEVTGQFADPNIFSVLSYNLKIGDPETAIADKNSVVLSAELAAKLFIVPEKAIGETIEWDNDFFNKSFIVTGVFNPLPKNATRQFDLMINYENLIDADQWADHWKGGYAENYVILREGTDLAAFNEKIENHYDDKVDNEKFTVFLQKYSDRYLFDEFEDGRLIGGRIANVRLFTYIAIFIVLIAAINFINLATAQASTKLKEIGVKKAMGGNRRQLMFQFLTESTLMSLISVMIAVGLVYLLLPYFNQLIEQELFFDLISNWQLVFTAIIGLGLLAGVYPAFYLSSFKSVMIMKGKLPIGAGEKWLRKGLVITQFSLSVIFIVGMLVVHGQLSFIERRPLGYDKSNLLMFDGKGSEEINHQLLLAEIQRIPGVINASNLATDFLGANDKGSGFIWGDDQNTRNYLFRSPKIGYNSIETLGIKLLEGRTYDPSFSDDDKRIILNESAVKLMGLENPVGKRIRYGDDDYREIIGVVEDFHYGSLHKEIAPLIFRFRDWGRNYFVRIQHGNELKTIDQIEEVYHEFYPKYQFESKFLDDEFESLHATEQRVGSLSSYFAFFAILISSLGLLGLVIFTTERRIKEIGIRKVLGCSVTNIVFLLSWDFTKMVLTAILIAVPLSYFGLKDWLQDFAYHIDLSWWYFISGGAVALLIAWTITSTKTIRTAIANPVKALKDE